MIRIDFDPTRLDEKQAAWLRDWQQQARRALERSRAEVASGELPRTNSRGDVWRAFRRWLTEHFFHDKCGYCEGIVGEQSDGAAEHWRPKAGVRTLAPDGSSVEVSAAGGAHRGYWWLAFAWENLVPTCESCNRRKGTLFPLAGEHSFEPDATIDVDMLDERERPLLLHPFRGDDPADHIAFNDRGEVSAKGGSKQGWATIVVLGLDRRKLTLARAEQQRHARDAIGLAISDVFRGAAPEQVDETIDFYEGPSARYSGAVAQVLAPTRAAVRDRLDRR